MTMPLDRYTVIKRYRVKHVDNVYFDIDLVNKAYSRCFQRFMYWLSPPIPTDWKAEGKKWRKLDKEQKKLKPYKETYFADMLDKEIKKMKKEGLKRYVYLCEKCGSVKTFVFTDAEKVIDKHWQTCDNNYYHIDRIEKCGGHYVREEVYDRDKKKKRQA